MIVSKGTHSEPQGPETRNLVQEMTTKEYKRANIFEPIPEQFFFGYSLGGYCHRERWSRTRRNQYKNDGAEII
jgi:hypothetical protein